MICPHCAAAGIAAFFLAIPGFRYLWLRFKGRK